MVHVLSAVHPSLAPRLWPGIAEEGGSRPWLHSCGRLEEAAGSQLGTSPALGSVKAKQRIKDLSLSIIDFLK